MAVTNSKSTLSSRDIHDDLRKLATVLGVDLEGCRKLETGFIPDIMQSIESLKAIETRMVELERKMNALRTAFRTLLLVITVCLGIIEIIMHYAN